MPGSMDGLGLAHAVHARWPSIKIIVVSGQLKPAGIDLPPCSRFFGEPLEAGQMIAQMRSMMPGLTPEVFTPNVAKVA
jgi:hypothetical protein